MTDVLDRNPLAARARAAVLARIPLTGVRVLDAHAHVGPYSRFFIPAPGAEAMVRIMDRCGVRAACVSSHLAVELDARRGNEVTAAAVDASAGRLHGLLTLNPHQDPEAEVSRWADDPRFVGVKLHPDLHEYPVTGGRYAAAWEVAAARALPVLVHTAAGSPYDDHHMVGRVAERHHHVRVLMGHAGSTRPAFEEAAELAHRLPNLYLELCGSFMTGWWVRRLVDSVGSNRVLYGSDFPFIDMRYSIGRVLFAGLDDDDLRLVLGGSLAALLPPATNDTPPSPTSHRKAGPGAARTAADD